MVGRMSVDEFGFMEVELNGHIERRPVSEVRTVRCADGRSIRTDLMPAVEDHQLVFHTIDGRCFVIDGPIDPRHPGA